MRVFPWPPFAACRNGRRGKGFPCIFLLHRGFRLCGGDQRAFRSPFGNLRPPCSGRDFPQKTDFLWKVRERLSLHFPCVTEGFASAEATRGLFHCPLDPFGGSRYSLQKAPTLPHVLKTIFRFPQKNNRDGCESPACATASVFYFLCTSHVPGQLFVQVHNEVLRVGHNPACGKASPVAELIHRELGNIHAVEIHLPYRTISQYAIGGRHVPRGNGV